MKLSETQEKVLNKIKRSIDDAKQFESYEQLFNSKEHYGCYRNLTYKEVIKKYGNDELYRYEKYWEEQKYENITLIYCNSKTLKKLEKLGYIEIIRDSTGETFGYDKVRLIKE